MTKIRMQALKTFLARGSEAAGDASGNVRRGREFNCDSDGRATELVKKGLARRLDVKGAAAKRAPKANKAAGAGPLRSAGGKTGAAGQPSSSLPGLPQQERATRSRRRRTAAADAGQE